MKKNLDILIGQIVLVLLGLGLMILAVYIRLYPQIKMGKTIVGKDIVDSLLWLIAHGSYGLRFFIVSMIFFATAILLQYAKRKKMSIKNEEDRAAFMRLEVHQ